MDLRTAVAVSMLPMARGRASALFKDLRQRDPAVTVADVIEASGLVSGQAATARTAVIDAALEAADRALDAGRAGGMLPVPWFDPRYPALLGCVVDPPPVLWTRGDADVLGRVTVAIVGSRAATPYALDVGARLGAELASRGVVVTSGLARGVDSAAHRGCLSAGGLTIAVLGSGVDRVYPSEHHGLAATITKQGVLVSELGPGGPPLAQHFPLRNRIISGISLAVVVVEANEKSGSLITARCALEQGRDVMAVPGSVLSGRNRGSHSLLKDGAKVVESADDILEDLGWPVGGPSVSKSGKPFNDDPLLARMDPGESYGFDQLVDLAGLSPSKLMARLTEFELAGKVLVAGGRFTRVLARR